MICSHGKKGGWTSGCIYLAHMWSLLFLPVYLPAQTKAGRVWYGLRGWECFLRSSWKSWMIKMREWHGGTERLERSDGWHRGQVLRVIPGITTWFNNSRSIGEAVLDRQKVSLSRSKLICSSYFSLKFTVGWFHNSSPVTIKITKTRPSVTNQSKQTFILKCPKWNLNITLGAACCWHRFLWCFKATALCHRIEDIALLWH